MAPRKGKVKQEEQVVSLGPQVSEGEDVFGTAHIFASFNDTFVHVTDLSGLFSLLGYCLSRIHSVFIDLKVIRRK